MMPEAIREAMAYDKAKELFVANTRKYQIVALQH